MLKKETIHVHNLNSTFNHAIKNVAVGFVSPASFEDGNVVGFSAPRFEVDAGLEPVLLEGLEDHTFGIDFCGRDQSVLSKWGRRK